MASRNILEIGPGKWSPLHNRNTDALILGADENYFAIDINREQFEGSVWEEIRRRYGDRVCLIQADANHLPFSDESQDEIVALGVFAKDAKETDRVLKPGGILRIYIDDKEGRVGAYLRNKGYKRLDHEAKTYDYKDVAMSKLRKLVAERTMTQAQADEFARNYKASPITVIVYQKPRR